jgi:hypothetical protein
VMTKRCRLIPFQSVISLLALKKVPVLLFREIDYKGFEACAREGVVAAWQPFGQGDAVMVRVV